MKQFLILLLIAFVSVSCGKEKTVHDELIGDWLYERETFNSFTTFEDFDTEGYISFRDDETGNWSSNEGFIDFSLEWDLQADNEKISITKYPLNQPFLFPINTIFDLKRTNEDYFSLTFHIIAESPIDTLADFEQFENIILTRME